MNQNIKTSVGIIVAIILIITVGVFAWQFGKKSAVETKQPIQQASTSQKTVAQPTPNESTQRYIEVKELGFKIPVDSAVAQDLTYKIVKPTGVDHSSAAFSSKTLNVANKLCEDGVASIGRVPGKPDVSIELIKGAIAAGYIKQFDGFYLEYGPPQDSCTMGKNVELERKIAQAVSDGFKNASLVVSDIVDWQTYRNEKYGFELKYPSGYEAKIDENENSGNPLFYVKNPEKDTRVGGDGPYPYYAFMLNRAPNFLGGDPDKFQTPAEWAKYQGKIGSNLTEGIVSGSTVYAYDDTSPGGQQLKVNNIFLKKGNVYDFYTITYKKSDVGQKILSTFKFIN